MMVNALVTLRIEFFWQSVASGVVIVSSVALYTWLEKKDRDGARGLLAGLASPDSMKLIKLGVGLLGGIALFLIFGFLFAGGDVPSN